MTKTTTTPSAPTPSAPTNKLGFTKQDYVGAKSTLCAGCGHDSITAQIINAAFESNIEGYRVTKYSGIGCSSKTPAYFINQGWGFNSVHGRMPSIATGASLVSVRVVLNRTTATAPRVALTISVAAWK